MLGQLRFDDEVLEWVRAKRCTPAMRTNATSTRRRSSGSRPSTGGSASGSARCMSTSLTARSSGDFYDKMAGQWREEQRRLQHDIDRHEEAEQSYMDEGVRILELARNAQALFERQPAREKRRLLNFVLSNCSWEDGEVAATFRQPFDLLAETTAVAARSSCGQQQLVPRKMRFGWASRIRTLTTSFDALNVTYYFQWLTGQRPPLQSGRWRFGAVDGNSWDQLACLSNPELSELLLWPCRDASPAASRQMC